MLVTITELEPIEIQNDNGEMQDGIRATCPICGHTTESFGEGQSSVARCMVLMKEECPKGLKNFYKL